MNINLETIENYVNGQLSEQERTQFDERLRTDPAVANELAFYVLSKQVAHQQAREQRMAELNALRQQNPRIGQRSIGWTVYVAAASLILLLGLGWYFFRPTTEPSLATNQLVDDYVTAHFMELPTTMGSETDSLKLGIDLFNKGKLDQATVVFQDVLARKPDTDSALKYGGIASLRQGNYDKAIEQFQALSQRTDLIANPGAFYESLSLLKRGRPIDKSRAKKLLEDVINKNLEGKADAEKLILLL